MTDIEKLKELEAKATRGRWKVFATEREFVGGHTRQVYQIRTEKLHPQLKDHYPVVCECEQNLKDGQKHGIWLSKEDAAFIVAMRNALPALLDVASSTLTADAGDGELIARERDNARAECSWLANSLLKYCSDLQNIARDIEDEGDRYYFGSTNDADLLKEIVEKIENYGFNRITRASKWPDYIRQSAKAHARAESAEARATASESEAAALREISDLMQFVADECVDLRTVVYETGVGDADVAWRVVKFYMQEPQERIIAEESTPIEALRRARTALEGRDAQ